MTASQIASILRAAADAADSADAGDDVSTPGGVMRDSSAQLVADNEQLRQQLADARAELDAARAKLRSCSASLTAWETDRV